MSTIHNIKNLSNIKQSIKEKNEKNSNIKLPKLSKTRFVTGLQCMKALYYSCYHYEYRDELTEEQKQIFQRGTDIGIEAQKLYPGGILVEEGYRQIKKALERTADLVKDAEPGTVIYEAAFGYNDINIRADIIKMNEDNTWDLMEVKSSKLVKKVNIEDIGIQTYVMEKSGVPVSKSKLIHMASDYDYNNPDWSIPKNNFTETDLTEDAKKFAKKIPKFLNIMKMVLSAKGETPDIPMGSQCYKPYKCAFVGHCSKAEK